jgi:hypothetical protein
MAGIRTRKAVEKKIGKGGKGRGQEKGMAGLAETQ